MLELVSEPSSFYFNFFFGEANKKQKARFLREKQTAAIKHRSVYSTCDAKTSYQITA